MMEDEVGIIASEHELTDLASSKQTVLTSISVELNRQASAVTSSFWDFGGRYWLIMQSLFVATGATVGIVFFAVFAFVVENYHGAVAAFLSGIVALMVFHIQLLKIRERLHEWYNIKSLLSIQRFSVIITIISLAVIGIYLTLALVRHEEFEFLSHCFYPPAIFTFMIFIWSSYLFWVVSYYMTTMKEELS